MSIARATYILLSFAISVAAGLYWGSFLKDGNAAVSAIIDVLAILSAVLVAVISIIGDPSMLLPGNWRVGYIHAQEIQNRISRFSYLFLVYILTLIASIISIAVKDINNVYTDTLYSVLTGLAVFSFLLSIPLPFVLMSIQKDRMSEVVRSRRENGSASSH